MKKIKKSKPTKELLDTYKEITNFVHKTQEEKHKNINNFLNKKQKIKMPYKMYAGIKKSVIKKHEKEKLHNEQNEIIGETHKKQKLMTNIILNKLETQHENKKNKKLWISRNKEKSRIKNGVMTLSKNFMKNINQTGGNNFNNINKNMKKRK